MKVKTAELSGRALDWSVAMAEGLDAFFERDIGLLLMYRDFEWIHWIPSVDWSQCGPLIDLHSPVITICRAQVRTEIATYENDTSATGTGMGITYLTSFCRALVSLKLGDEVDIPDELMETTK